MHWGIGALSVLALGHGDFLVLLELHSRVEIISVQAVCFLRHGKLQRWGVDP